ncbi:tektin-1 [Menidia menidia]
MSLLDHSPHQGGGPDLTKVEVKLNHSELFRAECKRLIRETDKACKRMQDDDNRRLDQRVRDIQFLKKELELKLEEITQETDVLLLLQSRVMKAMEASTEPLRVTNLCLVERMKREPSERLHDNVDCELRREREVLEGVASLLQRVQEQISEQIRLNRSAKYHLEQDLKDKFKAQSIDNSCALMTAHSINGTQRSNNKMAVLPSLVVTPMQWENLSDINIAKAEHQRTNSVSLRALVESVLEQTAADMQKQVKATSAAIQLNVQQIKSDKSQMEDKMPKLQAEITNQQRIREDLLVAMTQNEHFLSLAQARLALRCQRPGKEQCHDPAQAQLLAEVQQLSTHIDKLREDALQSEEEQRALARCQLALREDIEIKAKSLYIDEVVCMQHRETIVLNKF